jgi:S1-C subfamily serine protease
VAAQGGARQGFIGISSTSVNLPARQRGTRTQEYGLLVTGVVQDSPADQAGLFVGDVIVGFEGEPVQEPEQLVMRLRGDRVGKPVAITLVRGSTAQDVSLTVGERQR